MTNNNPTKDDKEKLTERINLRLTETEYLKLNDLAKQQNLSVAHFLRSRVLELSPPILIETVKRIHDLPKVDPELMRALASIGNNINQLTRLANSQNAVYGKFDVNTLSQSLDRITEELQSLRQQYTVNKNVS